MPVEEEEPVEEAPVEEAPVEEEEPAYVAPAAEPEEEEEEEEEEEAPVVEEEEEEEDEEEAPEEVEETSAVHVEASSLADEVKDYIEDKIEDVVDHEYIEEKILSAPKLAAEYEPLEKAECHTCAIAADLKKQKIINDDLIKHDLLEG